MLPGTKVGPFEVVEAIGRGGMGEVYRARDSRLQRDVAIKTVSSLAPADQRFHERFSREARAIAALSHPNILAIYDVGSHDGRPWVAVELLEGDTLRARIDGSPLPLATALHFAIQIGRGLAAAHDRGIVHRDLKPENVFVTAGDQLKILDFGLATEPAAEAAAATETTPLDQTAAGTLLGTVGYMSPEQARGERADARADIFSFGCVLYEMLAGRRAFSGESRIDTLHAILKEHPPDLGTLRSDVPRALERVVRRCLEKSRDNRFQSARDLVFALDNLADDARSSSTPPAARRVRPPAKTVAMIGAGAVLAIAAVLFTTLGPASRSAAPVGSAPAADRRPLLAVLPFDNISRDGAGFFAGGMTEEIANQLSKLSALRVVSRTAVAAFKDARTDLPGLAKALGVGSVVTGTVREDGTRVRVSVELIDAASRQVLWSDQYDREGVDVFAAQSDIALRVAEALKASVTLEEQARIGKRPTSSVAAYELFIRSRRAPGSTTEERLRKSLELLQQAVAIDPKFAEAYSEIGNKSYFLAAYGDLPALARGLEAAHKALDIDPQLASAHHALGLNLHHMGRLGEALPAYRKAVELDPSYEVGLNDAGLGEAAAGRFDAALNYTRRSLALSPNTSTAYYHVGVDLLMLDDDERTERFLTEASARFPGAMRLQILLSALDLRRRRPDAALVRIRQAADKAPDNIEVLLTRAEMATFAGAPDAPAIVASLMARAADALFGHAPYPVKLAHALHLRRAGRRAEAEAILDDILAANRKAVTAGADWPIVFLQNAAVHALRDGTPAALDELERAYAAGWREWRMLAIDPWFESVRAEPKFRSLLSRIEQDVAGMRSRADYSGLP